MNRNLYTYLADKTAPPVAFLYITDANSLSTVYSASISKLLENYDRVFKNKNIRCDIKRSDNWFDVCIRFEELSYELQTLVYLYKEDNIQLVSVLTQFFVNL